MVRAFLMKYRLAVFFYCLAIRMFVILSAKRFRTAKRKLQGINN